MSECVHTPAHPHAPTPPPTHTFHRQVVHFESRWVGWITDHHTFKSFALWCVGFVSYIYIYR